MNPFEPPELNSDPGKPLCPWRSLAHLDWYVDVDDTEKSFEIFRGRLEQLVESGGLRTEGLLTLVSGASGCGKTSLLHRCAELVDRLSNQRSEAKHDPGDFIVDLSRYRYDPRVETNYQGRLAEVIGQVAGALADRGKVPIEESWLDDQSRPGHRNIYRALSRHAQTYRFTLVVLLPNILDYKGELKEYAWLAGTHPGVVFFAESSEITIDDVLDRHDTHDNVIGLTVNPIHEGDMVKFIRSRLNGHPADRVAQISDAEARKAEQLIQEIFRGRVPARIVVEALHRAWHAHAQQPLPLTLTAFDIIRTFGPYLTPAESRGGGRGDG